MVASASAAMVAATTTAAMTTAAVLREGGNWRERKTCENSECDEGFEKTESAHNPYLRAKPYAGARPMGAAPLIG
jgi:hypothetical protein